MQLRIINLKNGLEKTVDASNYTIEEFQKTYLAYEANGRFMVKIVR